MRKESLLLLVALLPNSGGDAAKADRCGREHVAWLRGSNAALASLHTGGLHSCGNGGCDLGLEVLGVLLQLAACLCLVDGLLQFLPALPLSL